MYSILILDQLNNTAFLKAHVAIYENTGTEFYGKYINILSRDRNESNPRGMLCKHIYNSVYIETR